MNVVILSGSPHKKGSSARVTDVIISEISNKCTISRFDTAFMDISSCVGCDHCRKNNGLCVFQDQMLEIRDKIIGADVVIIVSPLYYFGITSQLKKVVDRFYAFNLELRSRSRAIFGVFVGADIDDWAMDGVKKHLEVMSRYLNWELKGVFCGLGIAKPSYLDNNSCLDEIIAFSSKII